MRENRSLLGWYAFDWASQPFHTLLITFIFAPYLKELLGSGSSAQTVWGLAVGAAGLIIALASPWLGAVADRAGGRMGFVAGFSVLYVLGAWGLWWSAPSGFSLPWLMASFVIGMIGVEFTTLFTNSMLPDLATKERVGRASGTGWALGYVGGLIALVFVLVALADNAATGKTLIGISPLFGLDAAAREGVRAVGPFTALWYLVFMVPFFLWVRLPAAEGRIGLVSALRRAGPDLAVSLRALPKSRPYAAFLAASMLYRDALNGFFAFGGIYAAGVLGWSITAIGVFGIITLITGALFAWLGGRADDRFGPRAVIVLCLVVLIASTSALATLSRASAFGIVVAEGSRLPDIGFFLLGGLIGAAGGALQAASRTLLTRLAPQGEMTQAFGLYALAGKATAFLAPLSISAITHLSGNQTLGLAPLIVLFLAGLILLLWAKPQGDRQP